MGSSFMSASNELNPFFILCYMHILLRFVKSISTRNLLKPLTHFWATINFLELYLRRSLKLHLLAEKSFYTSCMYQYADILSFIIGRRMPR